MEINRDEVNNKINVIAEIKLEDLLKENESGYITGVNLLEVGNFGIKIGFGCKISKR